MKPTDNPWTESQVAALKRLWNRTNLSASAIALNHWREVGDRTRNSILGKLYRLGLMNRMPQNSHHTRHRTAVTDKPIMDGKWK